jgi:hypothetical protein
VTPRRITLPLHLPYLGAFAALSFLCLGAHEVVHHLTARAICGEWGTMTFWTFHLADGCRETDLWLLATLAGPLLTHSLIWTGLLLAIRGRALAGVTMILANLPLARFVTVLMRGGDEMVIGRTLSGEWSWLPLLALTTLLLLPPLTVAFRALAPRRRIATFAAFLVLPLFWDMIVKRVLLTPALAYLPTAVVGIPLLAIATYALAAAVLVAWWPRTTRGSRVSWIGAARGGRAIRVPPRGGPG